MSKSEIEELKKTLEEVELAIKDIDLPLEIYVKRYTRKTTSHASIKILNKIVRDYGNGKMDKETFYSRLKILRRSLRREYDGEYDSVYDHLKYLLSRSP